MHEDTSILLVGAGDVALRALRLLGPIAAVTPVAVETIPNDVARYSAVGLVTHRPYPGAAARLYERCWSARIPCCEATLFAHEFRVGPAVVVGTTPCYDCFRRRVRSQAEDLVAYDLIDYMGHHSVGAWFQGELSALNEQVAAAFAAEVIALATHTNDQPERGLGRFWRGDCVYGEFQSHVFARIGLCERCGGEAAGSATASLVTYFENRSSHAQPEEMESRTSTETRQAVQGGYPPDDIAGKDDAPRATVSRVHADHARRERYRS
jgi:bacteriocin biosynthesis cyclodehydratase domain-containing protein